MAKDLTALALEKLQPGAARREVPDGKVRGLHFVLQPTGRGSWAYRYRNAAGKPAKLTIGKYPDLSLDKARRAAELAAAKVAEGQDPAVERAAEKSLARKPKDHELVEKVVERFLDRHARPKTREATYRETKRILEKEIVERWRGKPMLVITRADIHALLDEIVDRGSPVAANRSLGAIRPLFRWAVERDIIKTSPCEGVRPPAPPKERDRFLSDQELRTVWRAAGKLGYPFGPVVQLLVLLGQRRDEVAGMTWAELDLEAGLWTLPPDRVKNAKGHVVPLLGMAREILASLPRIASEAGFVFTRTGKTHVVGFGKAKERLDSLITEAGGSLLPWVLHDLRRTMATGCAGLGVAPQVVEAILNHRSGTIRGVAAVYNRYDHAAEKRAALEHWGRHVAALLGKAGATPLLQEGG